NQMASESGWRNRPTHVSRNGRWGEAKSLTFFVSILGFSPKRRAEIRPFSSLFTLAAFSRCLLKEQGGRHVPAGGPRGRPQWRQARIRARDRTLSRAGGEATGSLSPDISCGTGRCHPDFNPVDAELHQAPILSNLRRMMPYVALAKCV